MERFELGDELGRGGFAVVRAARRLSDNRLCVIKTLLPEAEDGVQRRFVREMKLQAQLNHPNIVPLLDVGPLSDTPWYAMPWAAGNLQDFLTRGVTERDALALLLQASDGLAFAHSNGIIHRDVKPGNILIFTHQTSHGLTAAVADFGLGKRLLSSDTVITRTGQAIGTWEYAAPEQLHDMKSVDRRADVYSLGRVLYQMLAGRVPEPFRPLDLTGLSGRYSYILARSTEYDRSRRYPTVDDFINDLTLLLVRRGEFEKPETRALELIDQLNQRDGDQRGIIAELVRLLLDNRDDYRVMINVVPRIPVNGLKGMIEEHVHALEQVIYAYQRQLEDPLTLESCDVAGRFFQSLFEAGAPIGWRGDALVVLCRIGHRYDRWEVGDVLARLVAAETDSYVLITLANYLADDRAAADWAAQFLLALDLTRALRSALVD